MRYTDSLHEIRLTVRQVEHLVYYARLITEREFRRRMFDQLAGFVAREKAEIQRLNVDEVIRPVGGRQFLFSASAQTCAV